MTDITDSAWQDRISISPDIAGGKPVINGTRVPVEVIIGHLAGGDSISDVCESYRLVPEDVLAALAYAANLLREERVHALPHR